MNESAPLDMSDKRSSPVEESSRKKRKRSNPNHFDQYSAWKVNSKKKTWMERTCSNLENFSAYRLKRTSQTSHRQQAEMKLSLMERQKRKHLRDAKRLIWWKFRPAHLWIWWWTSPVPWPHRKVAILLNRIIPICPSSDQPSVLHHSVLWCTKRNLWTSCAKDQLI